MSQPAIYKGKLYMPILPGRITHNMGKTFRMPVTITTAQARLQPKRSMGNTVTDYFVPILKQEALVDTSHHCRRDLGSGC